MVKGKAIMKNKINAKIILNLLLQKHSKDLCIPECKTGGTWGMGKLYIMDLWVMRRSWTKPNIYCYEIKISRNDFLQDNKWNEYLKYCSDFYFVSPPGIIQTNELPPEVGLIETSKNCKKLFTKKKAVSRIKNELPNTVFKYVLMWRSIQKTEQEINSTKTYWKEWIKNKKIDNKFGHFVSKNIRKIIEENINKVKKENELLKIENDNLKDVKEIILKLGFSQENIVNSFWNAKINFKREVEKVTVDNGVEFKQYINNVIHDLQKALSILNQQNGK